MPRCLVPLVLMLVVGGVAMAQTGFVPQIIRVELQSGQIVPGQNLRVTYWWRNTGDAISDGDLRVFVHCRLRGAPEDQKAYPLFGGDYVPSPSTLDWTPGRVMRMTREIGVPGDAHPGQYDLLLGLYALEGGGRAKLANADLATPDLRYKIGAFEIVPPGTAIAAEPKVFEFVPLSPQPKACEPAEKSAQTITLSDGAVKVICDAARPTIYAYESAGKRLAAELERAEPRAAVDAKGKRLVTGQSGVETTYDVDAPIPAHTHGIIYTAHMRDHGIEAVSYRIALSLNGSALTISLRDVVEHPGYRLMSVTLPRLASTTKAAGGVMVIPTMSGRLVSPATALPDAQEHAANWFTLRACAAVVNPSILATLDVPSQEDVLLSSVADFGSDEMIASLSARLTYRVAAQKPEFVFIAHKETSIRLDLLAAKDKEPLSWTDAAKVLRARVAFKPPTIYRNTVIYKIFCDTPGSQDFTTFDQALDLVRKVHNLTDGMPQIAYLVGWQHEGHDTGYPDVFTVNPRLGGYDKLCQVMRDAEKYNAILSFHDNYDDAYKNSPAWRDDIMARDDRGEIMGGGVWAGGQSYIISYAAYLQRGGLDRVRRTLKMFPIRKSYHIDVMSACPERRDWNPEHPVSADEMLAARHAIVHEFNKAGVDVTSEGFTGPMLGVIGHAWHSFRKRDHVYENDFAVPFIQFIYHGHATSGGGVSPDSPPDLSDALLYGLTFSNDYTKNTPLKFICDQVFLVAAPFLTLREREMQRYESHGTERTVWYGPDSYVRVDEADGPHGSYEVRADGDVIARDYNVLVPGVQTGRYLCYSRYGGEVRMPLPKALKNAKTLNATALTPEGPGESVPVRIEGGDVVLQMPAQEPVRVGR